MIVKNRNQFYTNMNDLNLRFERNPSSRHMTYLKVSFFSPKTETNESQEQSNRRAVDDSIAMAESECMDQYYACRLSDWMNHQLGMYIYRVFEELVFCGTFHKR